MICWLERAKSHFSETAPAPTAKTDERGVLSVSSVGVVALFENHALSDALMEAAMRRCDQFNDSDKARQDMREQILETPPHLRQDLLDHFMGRPTGLH